MNFFIKISNKTENKKIYEKKDLQKYRIIKRL